MFSSILDPPGRPGKLAAGRAMARETVSYDHLRSFYSDLFELGYEAVGEVDARLETVADWKEPYREGVIYYLRAGRLRGVPVERLGTGGRDTAAHRRARPVQGGGPQGAAARFPPDVQRGASPLRVGLPALSHPMIPDDMMNTSR